MTEQAKSNRGMGLAFRIELQTLITEKVIEFEELTGMTVERIRMDAKTLHRPDGSDVVVGRDFDFTITI